MSGLQPCADSLHLSESCFAGLGDTGTREGPVGAGHGAPGNATRGQGGSCLRVVFSSASPSPTSGDSNGFGISAVHFLEGVNYLVDEHICQQAEAAASVRAHGSRLPVGPTRACSLLFRGRLAPLATPRMGTSRACWGCPQASFAGLAGCPPSHRSLP